MWELEDAMIWAAEHDFVATIVRYRTDDMDNVTHIILPQFDPEEAVEQSFRTISDDFPEGVSASIAERKSAMNIVEKTGNQSADDPLEFILSTETKDRDGDIIRSKGWDLDQFRKNPVALFGHNHSKPIGTWENVRIEGKRLIGKLKLAAAGTSAEIDTIRSLVEQKILKAVSVGFMPLEYDFLEDKSGIDFKKTALHECSLVSVPANPQALAIAKSFGANPKIIFKKPDDQGHSDAPTMIDGNKEDNQTGLRVGYPNKTLPPIPQKGKAMNISDRIKANNERLIAVKDRLTEIKSILENDDEAVLTDEDQAELETLTDEQETLIKSIASLNKIESGLAAKAEPVTAHSAARVPARPAQKEAGGSLLVKNITANLIAHMTQQRPADVVEQMYGDDDRVKAVSKHFGVNKAAVDSADTTTAGWAAELIRTDYRAFLDDMAAVSIYGALLQQAGAQSLDFGGANSISIPRRDPANQSYGAAAGLAAAAHLGGQIGGSFVGEGGVIPVKAMALASQTMNRYKLAVISTMTNEILEQSTPNIEGIVRRAILDDTALALDGALLDGVGMVAGVRPASVFNGVAGTASAGVDATSIIADMKTLLGALSAINGANPVLIMNSNRLLGLSTITTAAGGFMFRDDIAQGRLLGVPVLSSTTVNPTTVGILDAGSFVGANDTPTFAISDQAALTMANADGTAPSQAGVATDHTGGDLGTEEQVPPDGGIILTGDTTAAPAGTSVAGYQAQSLFQSYSTGIRMVLPTSFGMVRSNAVAYLTGVNW